MARVVILGAEISGHTAALHLRRLLGKGHEVVVVSPNADWNWIPSNIWVGVGRMSPEEVTFLWLRCTGARASSSARLSLDPPRKFWRLS
jgi:NADH dehydrogenase FAD-containing subunit